MSSTPSPVPSVPQVPMVKSNGDPTPVWYQFFVNIWLRTGGATGSISTVLDSLTSAVGSVLYRAQGGWAGLAAGVRYSVLRMGSVVPEWSLLDGNSFGPQGAIKFFAGPPTGPDAIPIFRNLVTSDFVPIAGAFPGVASAAPAAAGDVGEYVSQAVPVGLAVPITSAIAANVASISLAPGDWDAWGNVGVIPAGGAVISSISAWISLATATDPGSPNEGAYVQIAPVAAAPLTLGQTTPVGAVVLQLAATGPVYLGVSVTFVGGTVTAFGFIGARRRR